MHKDKIDLTRPTPEVLARRRARREWYLIAGLALALAIMFTMA